MTDAGRGSGAARPDRARLSTLRRRGPGLRRLLSAGLVAAALAVGLSALAPAAPGTRPVVVATRDLPAGHRIAPGDVAVTRWPGGVGGTAGAMASADEVVGRTLAGPLARSTVVSDAQLLGPGLLTGLPPGLRAVPVQLAQPGAAGLVRRGDRVDLISTTARGVVADDVTVLADPSTGPGADGEPAAVLVIAVTPGQALDLARAGPAGALMVAVHPHDGPP